MSATLEQLQRLEWPSVVRTADGAEWRNGATGKTWFSLRLAMSAEELFATGPIEIVTIATDDDEELVCPHCGYRHMEPMEFFEGDETVKTTCDDCEQEFIGVADYTVTYSARKVES